MGKLYNQRHSKEIRKDLRNHPTQAELKLWQKLKHNKIGHKFRRQHGIENYIADFRGCEGLTFTGLMVRLWRRVAH